MTISGRTIRNEAQASPLLAQLAIERVDTLLAQVRFSGWMHVGARALALNLCMQVPEELRTKAEGMRRSRTSRA